ncbi:hypothetical protein [Diplocloster hominis]|uniref:hypothetical protein n=1 Tax=Diplocloster hominis TaxID=3079010 RepID=UPI0031BAEC00
MGKKGEAGIWQMLSFDPVLPWKGQPETVERDEDGRIFLKIKAPQADRVSFVIGEKEYGCTRGPQGVWKLLFPFCTGFHFVQLVLDGMGEDFYRLKEVPHGSVRREYYYSAVTMTWESCLVYTPPGYDHTMEREYPVLYLQHGHGENEVGWITAGKVNFIVDNLLFASRLLL